MKGYFETFTDSEYTDISTVNVGTWKWIIVLLPEY